MQSSVWARSRGSYGTTLCTSYFIRECATAYNWQLMLQWSPGDVAPQASAIEWLHSGSVLAILLQLWLIWWLSFSLWLYISWPSFARVYPQSKALLNPIFLLFHRCEIYTEFWRPLSSCCFPFIIYKFLTWQNSYVTDFILLSEFPSKCNDKIPKIKIKAITLWQRLLSYVVSKNYNIGQLFSNTQAMCLSW